ncbi:uncharacterized protein LOC111356209 [Spodoptera litura]|uniref:Uncharacterized protein LOC111356209 n=1 Tax=Spodoptera litura TaxID=69820 RepID=A0A9J7IV77_SPOLT|nr:uncharacterized protein LOC111356209 [Spodoptera litura]
MTDSRYEHMQALFTTKMAAYEEKLQKLSAQSPAPDLALLHKDFTEFKQFMLQALANFKSQSELLALGLDRHETAMRRKVLLVHGIPERRDEQLPDVVIKVFHDQMKLAELRKGNIHVCHRLGSSGRGSRPILVRFYMTEHRHLVWDNKKSLKGTGITISEFLTQLRHRAFMDARNHFGISNCWSVEGKIVIVAPDKTRHKIECISQLQELIVRFPLTPSKSSTPEPASDLNIPARITAEPEAKVQKKVRPARRR